MSLAPSIQPAAPARRARPMRRLRPHRAFTLIEVLLASAILAATMFAITASITAGQQQGLSAVDQARMVELAENTADRVLARPYNDPEGDTTPGPDTGETTATLFDAVDDFHSWAEAAGALTDAAGAALPTPYQTLARSVTVADQTLAVAALGGDINGKLVTVTVTDPEGRAITVQRFVAEPAS
ncbi:MAG: prepilin-type N-terminal cleavage/methylation domain-containing protein [Planctomycetota bacterium]